MAEAVRFELTVPCGTLVFKTSAISRTLPHFPKNWLRGTESNRRSPGYEPDELPLLHPATKCYTADNPLVPPSLLAPFTLFRISMRDSVRHYSYLPNVPYFCTEDSRLPLFTFALAGQLLTTVTFTY